MPIVDVDSLRFSFRPRIVAEKYDDWNYYQKVLRVERNLKAVDVVAVRVLTEAWLIEAKDFRMITQPPAPANLAGLAQTVNAKVRDSLTGLGLAAGSADRDSERRHAQWAVAAGERRVVLHLEPHSGPHSRLFPQRFAASVLQSLKQLVKDVDSRPKVLCIANTAQANVPWNVT